MAYIGWIVMITIYLVMSYFFADAVLTHIRSERRTYEESQYWVLYDWKYNSWKTKKRGYFFAIMTGLFWPVVFVYGIFLIAGGDK